MGLQRQLYRSQAKQYYKKFCENWKLKAAESPDGKMHDPQGNTYRRPTFAEWLKMNERVRKLTAKQKAEAPVEKKEEELTEKDLSWD